MVLISVRGCVNSITLVQLEGLGNLRESSVLIGIRTRLLPACGVVSQQPTACPRNKNKQVYFNIQIMNASVYVPPLLSETLFLYGRETWSLTVT
jgi:hypothetical protein